MSSCWHGTLLADVDLPPPKCTTQSSALSRPQYSTVRSDEYEDSPEVLDVKADLVIQLLQSSTKQLIYTGAGISTSAGIQDYASKAASSVVQARAPPNMSRLAYIEQLVPTPAHRVIAAMEKIGLVWGWLQQNHDGLAQKAGFPCEKVNEIHGSWLDNKHNPCVQMSGELRADLYSWMLEMERECDFAFAIGTSLSGMNADRCVQSCAKRFAEHGQGRGIAILSVQRTPLDDIAAVRVYARIDHFMLLLARKLQLKLGTKVHPYAAVLPPPPAPRRAASRRRGQHSKPHDEAPRSGETLP